MSKADTINVAPNNATESAQAHPTERTPLLSSISSGENQYLRDSTITIAESLSPKSSRPPSSRSGIVSDDRVHSPEPILNQLPDLHQSSTSYQTNTSSTSIAASSRPRLPLRRNTTFYNSFPNSPNDSRTNLARYDAPSDLEVGIHGQASNTLSSAPESTSHTVLRRLKKRLTRIFISVYDFMTVPMWSAVASLFVACIPKLKHALEHHLQPLNGAINTAGKCAVPLTLVVLGAYFHVPPPDTDQSGGMASRPSVNTSFLQRILQSVGISSSQNPEEQPPKKTPRPGETKTVVLGLLSRMVLTPVLLVPFLILATKFDWHAVFDEYVFLFQLRS